MKLRLCVQRHELPEARILWPVATEVNTVSELLEAINNSVPLESDGWGLDDYVVEVGGFECLHYAHVSSILEENDAVTVRPLKSPEIRARTQSGRYQISSAGAHLVDGIAFGRSYVRKPNRPRIHIPPRKRRRISEYDASENEDNLAIEDNPRELRITSTFDDIDVPEKIRNQDSESDKAQLPLSIEDGNHKTRKRRRSVQSLDEPNPVPSFEIFEDENDDDDDEDEFEPSDGSSSEEEYFEESEQEIGLAGGDENLEPSSTGEVEFQHTTAGKLQSSGRPIEHVATRSNHSSSNSASDSSDSDSDPDSDAENSSSSSEDDNSVSSEDSGPEIILSKAQAESARKEQGETEFVDRSQTSVPASAQAAPGHGKASTKARNARRRLCKKLKYLAKLGLADRSENGIEEKQHAEGNDATKLEHAGNTAESMDLEQENNSTAQHLPGGKKRKAGASSLPGSKQSRSTASGNALDESTLFQIKRRKLLESIAAGGVDIEDDLLQQPIASGSVPIEATNVTITPPPVKEIRNKLDVASSRRLLFGSLGIKAPKDEVDEQKLRQKLRETAEKPVKAALPPNPTTTYVANEEVVDPNLWKTKIDLRAVECCDAGIELSTPPFPFVQRWDPQQQIRGKGKKNKRKRKSEPEYYEEYDEFEQTNAQEETTEHWDYDDAPDATQDEVNQVTEQLLQDILASADEEEDLLALPSDLSTYANLVATNALPGSIIAFKQLEVSAATNWQPAFSPYRTATINSVETGFLLVVTLAKRDRQNQDYKYDEEGQRLYGRFEMPDDQDDGVDHGVVEVPLAEMVEPKLVRAGLGRASVSPGFNEQAKHNAVTLIIPDSIDPVEYPLNSDGESQELAEDSEMTMQAGNSNDFNEGQDAQLPPAYESVDSFAGSASELMEASS